MDLRLSHLRVGIMTLAHGPFARLADTAATALCRRCARTASDHHRGTEDDAFTEIGMDEFVLCGPERPDGSRDPDAERVLERVAAERLA